MVSSQFPLRLSSKDKSRIVRKSAPFTWIGGNLFKLSPYQILRHCVREEEVFDILLTCHNGPCGGHFAAKRTTFKILQVGYYWPTLHQDVRRYISQCDRCQRMGKPTQEALYNLGKVLSKCIEMNLSLSTKKCEFMITEGTVLGHTISQQGLQVDPNKISII